MLDSPSYFTQWFATYGNNTTLFLDLDPNLFELIYNHLQGYLIVVQDAHQMINLWLDANFYSLTRLQRYLTECDIHCVVGGTQFKIPRALLGPGNLPNYFTLQYDDQLLNDLEIIEQCQLLRPAPHCVVHRLAHLFHDLLECLRGNFFVVTDDKKRAALLKECRFYQFFELERQLIKHIINDDILDDSFDIQRQYHKHAEKRFVFVDSSSWNTGLLLQGQPMRAVLMQVILDDNLIQQALNLKVPLLSTTSSGDQSNKGNVDKRQQHHDWFI